MDGIFSILKENLNGLRIQMKKMQLLSENIANAERLPDENGKIYHRKILVPTSQPDQPTFAGQLKLNLEKSSAGHIAPNRERNVLTPRLSNQPPYQIKEIRQEKLVYDPSNPRADENGYVRLPDINLVTEMVELVEASRTYEANITVMRAAKELAKNTLKL